MQKSLIIFLVALLGMMRSYAKEVTIIFVRHAESIGNYFAYVDTFGLTEYLGQTRETPTEETILTALGRMQAAKCGDNLRDLIVKNQVHVYRIYSSTYLRANQTAKIIASKLYFGELENSGKLNPSVEVLEDLHHTRTMADGSRETKQQVLARTERVVSQFVNDKRETGGTYIIVGHADPWRYYFSKLDPSLVFDANHKITNCAVTIISYPDDGPPKFLIVNVGLDQESIVVELPNKI